MNPQALVTATILPTNLTRPQLKEIIIENNRQISILHNQNVNLQQENDRLRNENARLVLTIEGNQKTIKFLQEENKKLNDRISVMEAELKDVKEELKIQKNERVRFDALVKLHECNALVNKEFKKRFKEFRAKNGLKSYRIGQNVGDFINDPPEEKDSEYEFWMDFIRKYPGVDNSDFRQIYYMVSNDRAYYGAHKDVSRLNERQFDDLMKIVFVDYNENRKLYEDYRNFLYQFPG